MSEDDINPLVMEAIRKHCDDLRIEKIIIEILREADLQMDIERPDYGKYFKKRYGEFIRANYGDELK